MPEAGSKPTKVGAKVMELQSSLPKARIMYCSATGALFSLHDSTCQLLLPSLHPAWQLLHAFHALLLPPSAEQA